MHTLFTKPRVWTTCEQCQAANEINNSLIFHP